MDQVKIGKLIATLRKEKGLTQGELGEKVGVSDGAVSKWERGTTCPDISIINTLSKTLGITSDELLTGELSKETQKRISHTKTLKSILPQLVIFLFVTIISIFIVIRNTANVYKLESIDDNITVNGKAIFKGDMTYILIDGIVFKNKDFNEIIIKNYEYKVRCDNEILFKKGDIGKEKILLNNITIKEFNEKFNINYSDKVKINKQTIIDNGLEVKMVFLANSNETINKKIKIKLKKQGY